MVFPLGYALPLAMIQALVNSKAFSGGSKTGYLVLLPLIGMLLDYAENTLIATQIAAYPALSQTIVTMASVATILKWTFLGLSFVCILCVFLLWLARGRKESS